MATYALMYDSDNETYPDGVRYIAAYVDGSRTGGNHQRAKAKHPDAKFLLISAVGVADADVIDIEPGCVWPVEAAIPWLRRQLAQGKTPIFYCNTATVQACYSAFYAAGLPELPWWRADYPGPDALSNFVPTSLSLGEIAWQFANPVRTGSHWDVSVISPGLQAYLDGHTDSISTASVAAVELGPAAAGIANALQKQKEEDDSVKFYTMKDPQSDLIVAYNYAGLCVAVSNPAVWDDLKRQADFAGHQDGLSVNEFTQRLAMAEAARDGNKSIG